ncbi:hypothetical protein [Lichenifustis flavocetrariae]|uniref:Uncharacterized protein n=1 Tax=Lichenifustis flavocetrariae TaxID=2949735 RepID=A0AA41YU76_9HYPH|nr:hypothetical protein [Lichenifustis flavocetrariae]MCW6507395.1 hypothetical protein [Lichenifustis flavocetrariae]
MEHVEEQGASVVLAGNFNPAIFNPDWLVRQEVVSSAELDEGGVNVIHAEVAQFKVGSLRFEILIDRFTVHALSEPFVRVADVIADIFAKALPHTPITAMGINYFAHFRVLSRQQQTAFGRTLAPIQPWGDWGSTLESDISEQVGGLTSLSMQQVSPPDRASGHIMVTVQPSAHIPAGQGVFFQHNDHFSIAKNESSIDFPGLCLKQLTPSLQRARSVLSHLISVARGL